MIGLRHRPGAQIRLHQLEERCGWLKDRYGLYWQIAPSILGDMMNDRDRMRAKRVAEAMLNMVKLDIEGLQSAYEGRSA